MLPDDLDGLSRLTFGDGLGRMSDAAVDWMDRPQPDFETAVSDQFQAVLAERLEAGPDDGITVGSAIFRVLLLHELQKTGALTGDEFRGLKEKLLGL